MGYKVAVVGATGNVGRAMLNILDERKFPADEVVALASRRSMGVEVSYGDRTLKVKALEHYDFSDVDICLMSAGGEVSKEWSPKIGAAGTVVIDNSSAWRMDPDVPLIVPEVNADATAGFKKKNIIANPNCSTAQLVVALKPLHDKATIKRVVVATYQSVSGAGKDATYISRIREDATVENGLVLWFVSDNLRKGAALNAIQIAEVLINRKLISAKQKAA